MGNVLKFALIYTGLYFVVVTLFTIFLIMIQIIWKPVLFMFVLFFTILTFGHFSNKVEAAGGIDLTPAGFQAMSRDEKMAALFALRDKLKS